MFMKHDVIAPARMPDILRAAESALRAIPPAFGLEATVAVNPFLGQSGTDLATASALMARVAGERLTRPREEFAAMIARGEISDDDLAAALIASDSPVKPVDLAMLKARARTPAPAMHPLPTIAELAARATGTDWPAVIARSLGLWAAGHYDRGQALWTPTPGREAYTAWREWASHDLTPEIAGLSGFCAHVAAAPDTAERAILRAAERLGLDADSAPTAFHRLLMDLGGWAQLARGALWRAELRGQTHRDLAGMLAIRLIWEEALLAHVPLIAAEWGRIVAAHAAPVTPTPDQVIDAILQDAAERAHQRDLARRLSAPAAARSRPVLQAAFCIDTRSEIFRRALEAQDAGIETLGFAGFFGLPLAHQDAGSDVVEEHLPVLLVPQLHTRSSAPDQAEARIRARATRAWGRFRQAAVSSFAFVEAAGLTYGAKLLRAALRLGTDRGTAPAPDILSPIPADARAEIAARVLKAMGLARHQAPLVLLIGHGAQMENNPHESAYHCGACGGHTGEVSARALAILLNDPETRAGLAAHGVTLAGDVRFVAGLHDTTTDEITLFDDTGAPGDDATLSRARAWLRAAGRLARAERAMSLPGATPDTLFARARDWAELRPEWGLAGCASLIAAPRSVTRLADLRGRSFLHSYDWRTDDGFATLELILTAPVVVASWITLQYYGSTVAPDSFGGGNKTLHNVVGGIGVVEGNGGRLRVGLPRQAVHDGQERRHDPLRLSVLIEAPQEPMARILDRHPDLRALFDNGWVHLLALQDGRPVARWQKGRGFGPV